MRRSIFIARLSVAVIVLLTGCAGPSGGAGSGPSHPDGAAYANGDALKGTWRGVFEQVQTGDSGRIHGDLVCQIKEDGTYQHQRAGKSVGQWLTRRSLCHRCPRARMVNSPSPPSSDVHTVASAPATFRVRVGQITS